MPDLSRLLITLGIVLFAAGLLIALLARLHLPVGRLPGDLSWRGRNWSVSVPLATSLLLSLVLWLINRFR